MCATPWQSVDGNARDRWVFWPELVASFNNCHNTLKYQAKMHICAASTPLGRVGKTSSDPAYAVPPTAATRHAFFWPPRFRLLRLVELGRSIRTVGDMVSYGPNVPKL